MKGRLCRKGLTRCGLRVVGTCAIALIATVVPQATAMSPQPLEAFQRAPTRTDGYPPGLATFIGGRFGRITTSRRIATYTDRRDRHASVYLMKTSRHLTCLMTVGLGSNASGGCSPSNAFIAHGRYVKVAEDGRLVIGVVRSPVTRVVIVGTRGHLHPVKITRDGGFIYD